MARSARDGDRRQRRIADTAIHNDFDNNDNADDADDDNDDDDDFDARCNATAAREPSVHGAVGATRVARRQRNDNIVSIVGIVVIVVVEQLDDAKPDSADARLCASVGWLVELGALIRCCSLSYRFDVRLIFIYL